MQNLNPTHYTEIVEGSGVSEAIAALNFRTIEDPRDADQLLNRNTKTRWKHSGHLVPAWAVAGIDPKTGETFGQGAQLKPDIPIEVNGKPQKYIGCSGEPSEPLFLDTGDPEYWPKVLSDRNVPLFITEGAKKAACLLTLQYAAISLPGVWNAQLKGRLKDSIKHCCGLGRRVYLCFDSDQVSNPKVQQALDRLGRLLSTEGCVVSVVLWDVQYKGIDDLCVQAGADAVHDAIAKAPTFEEWRDSVKGQAQQAKSENPDQTFLQRAEKTLYSDSRWIAFGDVLYRWEGTHYQANPDELEYPRLRAFCNAFKVEKEDKEGNVSISYPFAKPRFVKEVLEWVKQGFSVPSDQINPPGINCTNGVLELRWKEQKLITALARHDPDRHFYLSEPQVTYNQSADSVEYERLMQCLDPAPREIWERTIAASLDLPTVRQWKGRAVKALFLKGDGSNGKDTLRTIVEAVLGWGAIASCSATDFKQYDQGRNFPIYPLRGKRLNWPSENADVGRIDELKGLRAAITGDPITFEAKNKMGTQEPCKAVFLFNCNEAPNLIAQLKATETRWGMVPFNKTYVLHPSGPHELKADPRFKEDPAFVQKHILPAFLNRLLAQLQAVVLEGIDYSSTQDAFNEMQREASHLLQFAHDVGLEYDPTSSVTVKDLWIDLKHWYKANGTIASSKIEGGEERHTWIDQPRKGDLNVKGSNQVLQRFLEIFPKARRGTVTVEGLHNPQSAIVGIKIKSAKTDQFDQDDQDDQETPAGREVQAPTQFETDQELGRNWVGTDQETKNHPTQFAPIPTQFPAQFATDQEPRTLTEKASSGHPTQTTQFSDKTFINSDDDIDWEVTA
jgi:putative DNA primase/helicase